MILEGGSIDPFDPPLDPPLQEGALWPTVMITLEPYWCKVKLNWPNIASGIVALLDYINTNVNVIHCN